MSEPIDVPTLLAPLSTGEQGVGVDLRADFSAQSPYQLLRDARSAARAEERARDADGDTDGPEAAGWRDVLAVGQKALGAQSKDVEVAAWLTEALVRLHGLAGLTAGARLISGLCETYWDVLFPMPDEDGLEVRASPIGGLSGGGADGTIMQPLRRLPLFRRADGSPIGLYQWDQAEETSTLDQTRKEARLAAGTPELSKLESEARLDKGFLVARGREVGAAIEAWRELDSVVDQRFGSDAPSLRKVGQLLERMLAVIAKLGGVPTESAAESPAGDEAVAGAQGGAAGTAGGGGAAGAMTRESALRELDRIAEYFRRTEPHSPLAYTLEEAVRRGRMTDGRAHV